MKEIADMKFSELYPTVPPQGMTATLDGEPVTVKRNGPELVITPR